MNTRRILGMVMVAAGMLGCSGSLETGTRTAAGLTQEELAERASLSRDCGADRLLNVYHYLGSS